MKNKYYLSGTILGLCLVPLVAIYLVPLKVLLEFLSAWNFLIPVTGGYITAWGAGALADRFIHRRGIVVTVPVLVAVFITGVFIGCAINLLTNGELAKPPFGLRDEVWTWFIKPAYWLIVIGGPCAAVVAVVHYGASRLLCRRFHQRHYS